MASAATVVLPTESVVLISMSCLKTSRESWRVESSRAFAWLVIWLFAWPERGGPRASTMAKNRAKKCVRAAFL